MRKVDNEKQKKVWGATDGIIQRIEGLKGSQRSAELAKLRNSTGKPLGEAEDVWPVFFRYLPPEFLSENGRETYEENAIYITLQLYALCMQGASSGVISDDDYGSIGKTIAAGRDKDDPGALDRRFNALITATDFNELTYHLRHLISIVKRKGSIAINFPRLAQDLFSIQMGNKKKMCLKWASDYYSRSYQDEEQTDDDKNN